MKFSEAIEQFFRWQSMRRMTATVNSYDFSLRHFCLFVRNRELDQISLEDVTNWFVLMRTLGWQQNSFEVKAVSLRKFFEWCRHRGYNVLDPWLIPIPRREYAPVRVATEEQYHKIVAAIPRPSNEPRHIRNLALIRLLWDTGVRGGELLSLNVEHLDLPNAKGQVKTAKVRYAQPLRMIFWTQDTGHAIGDWLVMRENICKRHQDANREALFIGVLGDRVGRRLEPAGLREVLRRCSRAAGIPVVNAHGFRHRMGHHLAMKGANNSIISNLLGHQAMQSSYRYTKPSGKELEEVYRQYQAA